MSSSNKFLATGLFYFLILTSKSSLSFVGTGSIRALGRDSNSFDLPLTDYTHESITKSGIKAAVYQYYREKQNPPSSPTAPIDIDLFNTSLPLSIDQILQLFYGPGCTTNSAGYLAAVDEVAIANGITDLPPYGNRADFHFDGERFVESNANIIAMRASTLANLTAANYQAARRALGIALHTLQDFYSHSNWVEMGRTEPNPGVGNGDNDFDVPIADPSTPTCKPCPSANGACLDNLLVKDKLTSGYYRSDYGQGGLGEATGGALPVSSSSPETDANGDPVVKPAANGNGKCSHAGSFDASRFEQPIGGINKDTSNEQLSPHYKWHNDAGRLAVFNTARFMTDLRKEVGDHKFQSLLDLEQPQCLAR